MLIFHQFVLNLLAIAVNWILIFVRILLQYFHSYLYCHVIFYITLFERHNEYMGMNKLFRIKNCCNFKNITTLLKMIVRLRKTRENVSLNGASTRKKKKKIMIASLLKFNIISGSLDNHEWRRPVSGSPETPTSPTDYFVYVKPKLLSPISRLHWEGNEWGLMRALNEIKKEGVATKKTVRSGVNSTCHLLDTYLQVYS